MLGDDMVPSVAGSHCSTPSNNNLNTGSCDGGSRTKCHCLDESVYKNGEVYGRVGTIDGIVGVSAGKLE
ncbi:hypothetical protein Tco_0993930 [Tanacetum coccineum]